MEYHLFLIKLILKIYNNLNIAASIIYFLKQINKIQIK